MKKPDEKTNIYSLYRFFIEIFSRLDNNLIKIMIFFKVSLSNILKQLTNYFYFKIMKTNIQVQNLMK